MSSPEQMVMCVPKEAAHTAEDVCNNKAQKALMSSFLSEKFACICACVASAFCLLVFIKIDTLSYVIANVAGLLVPALMGNMINGLLLLVGLFFWCLNIKPIHIRQIQTDTPQEKAVRITMQGAI